MLLRGKRLVFILIIICSFLGIYLYSLSDDGSSFPLRAARKIEFISSSLTHGYTKKALNTAVNTVSSFTSKDANKLFEKAVKCLAEAKKDIADYLTSSTGSASTEDSVQPLEPKCSPDLQLVVLVTTRPGNFANRAAIRLAWGRMDSDINKHAIKDQRDIKWKTIFSVGLANSANIGSVVALEYRKFGDILRLPYQDSYKNLPNKTMSSLEWIVDNCRPKYVLKTDDDCFVNVFKMLSWLKTLPPSYQYIGRVNTEMPVIRDPKHRNFVPKEEHKENVYRPYCAGGGYILKGEVLKNVTQMGKKIKQIINEDAYMGMLTNALKIVPRNEDRFLPFIFFGPPVKKLNMCDWKDQFLVHNVLGKRQLVMHFNSIAMDIYGSLCETL